MSSEDAVIISPALTPVVESMPLPDSAMETATDSTPETGDLPPPLDIRQQLISRFESWVDRMLAGEPPPPGIPRELLLESLSDQENDAEIDLYSVFSSLTGLTGEIRLQGRTFKQLAEMLAPLVELPRKLDQLSTSFEQPKAEESKSTLPPAKAMLEVLLDLYDRLGRGVQNFDAAKDSMNGAEDRGWIHRVFGGEHSSAGKSVDALMAMRDGYALTLSRLSAALHQWDVEPIGQAGEPFDPRRMVAIDVQSQTEQPPGTVFEVNRSGCAVRGTVLITAQVTVAK